MPHKGMYFIKDFSTCRYSKGEHSGLFAWRRRSEIKCWPKIQIQVLRYQTVISWHAPVQPRVLHTSGCKHPGEGPGDPSSRHRAAAVASARCQGNAAAHEDAADEDAAGRVRWPRNPGRPRGRNNLFANMMLFISVAALEFWARTTQREFNGIWYPRLDTSLFLCQIINSFSNQHGKNMPALYAQILYRKTYIPKLGENRVVKIQHPNI